ncbi:MULTISPECIES: hypothetical protein [Sinobaca]|uniref:hypothetical protein n=1 Tax=Sinobaca TaxID=342943 RepID=UPI000E757162|nr:MULTISPECIES: hypothetical protein [Sinobaca]
MDSFIIYVLLGFIYFLAALAVLIFLLGSQPVAALVILAILAVTVYPAKKTLDGWNRRWLDKKQR